VQAVVASDGVGFIRFIPDLHVNQVFDRPQTVIDPMGGMIVSIVAASYVG
jgi:hypothetical protein